MCRDVSVFHLERQEVLVREHEARSATRKELLRGIVAFGFGAFLVGRELALCLTS